MLFAMLKVLTDFAEVDVSELGALPHCHSLLLPSIDINQPNNELTRLV